MSRLCHSIWTPPMKTLRWGIDGQLLSNFWLFALSVHYARKSGAEIVLHTDELGESLFSFLPYTDIFRTLDQLKTHERFWATGKIWAQEAEPLGSIHIDGDVFIKKARTLDFINFSEYDLIVQNIEENLGEVYEYNANAVFSALKGFDFGGLSYEVNSAYNCGIVGFNNQHLKDKYINGYKQMQEYCLKSPAFVCKLNNYKVDICPDLILEQWWLRKSTELFDCKVKVMFDFNKGNAFETAVQEGYAHVIGMSKYKKIDEVKARLLDENPELYNLTRSAVDGYIQML